MATPLDALVSLLDLEVIEVNIFRGHSPEENAVRVFGGQVARLMNHLAMFIRYMHISCVQATPVLPSCTK
jgi:acyl-CoA thioesterase